ncbi:hypothetical protein BG006_011406 [Podila minutissima]|uniref:Large ribosomal subunit protein mL67 n=1 Tax=Podila minutissima TaxID=64525 RepID=A0A9P5VP69_9FUNG|nr:hypothetical protein BG006_011406 [Podila minutissima]
MSASTVAKAATNTAKAVSATNTVYLFRHIQTSQVLVSLKNSVEKQSLKQITDETRRPAHVRPDHWQPLAAIQGFPHARDALSFHNSLRDHQLNLTAAKHQNGEHMRQPARLRAPKEMDQVDETLVKMVELLNHQPQVVAAKGKGFQILWERDGVRSRVLEMEGVSLPEEMQHGSLVVKRGRDIVNA